MRSNSERVDIQVFLQIVKNNPSTKSSFSSSTHNMSEDPVILSEDKERCVDSLSEDKERCVDSLQVEENHLARKTGPSGVKWRKIAAFTSVLALLLAIGLSVTLGVFLTKTECGTPPNHAQATSNYLGRAKSGSEVTYVCPRPLVFPDNNITFTIQCTNDLEWDVTDIPPCGRDGEKICDNLSQIDDFDLNLAITDSLASLEIKLDLSGQIPSSFFVDVASTDRNICSYANAEESQQESNLFEETRLLRSLLSFVKDVLPGKNKEQKETAYSFTLNDSIVDPGKPYEIRIRGSANVVALSLVQNDYLNITIHKLQVASSTLTETGLNRSSNLSSDYARNSYKRVSFVDNEQII